MTETLSRSARQIKLTETFAAHNYDPLPVVASHGDGSWVTDVDGRRYLDCLAAYSALNFGHRHPALIEAARAQLDRLTLTSRAFYNDQLGPFCRDLAALAGMECVLPMNTGVEAVETAIKVARRWGYDVKGVPEEHAQIVVMTNNFHGRTTTVISFSNDHIARRGYGPFTPGFVAVPFGDAEALAGAITPRTVAVLLEPVQGEAGVLVPPPGYQYGVSVPTLACYFLPTRFSQAWDGAGRHSPANARTSYPMSTCWARRSVAGLCRCPRSCHEMTFWV